MWDAATGAPLGEPMVHKGGVVGLAFSPDAKTLLASVNLPDGCSEVSVWDAPSGPAALPPRPFPRGVAAIAFDPEGKTAIVSDGKMHIWPLPVPVTDDVERLRLRLQVWTGMELRDVVGCQPLNSEGWLLRKRELERPEQDK